MLCAPPLGSPSAQAVCQVDHCANPQNYGPWYFIAITSWFDPVQIAVYPFMNLTDCCRVCYSTPGCDVYFGDNANFCEVWFNSKQQTGNMVSDACPVGLSDSLEIPPGGNIPRSFAGTGPCYDPSRFTA